MHSKFIKTLRFFLGFLILHSTCAAQQIDGRKVDDWWSRIITMPLRQTKNLFAAQNNLDTGCLEAVYNAFGGSAPNAGTGPIIAALGVSSAPGGPAPAPALYDQIQQLLVYFSNPSLPPPPSVGQGITNLFAAINTAGLNPSTASTLRFLSDIGGVGDYASDLGLIIYYLDHTSLPLVTSLGPAEANIRNLLGIDPLAPVPPLTWDVIQALTATNLTLGTGDANVGASLNTLVGITWPANTIYAGITGGNTNLGAGWPTAAPHVGVPPADIYTKILNFLTRLGVAFNAGLVVNIPAATPAPVDIESAFATLGI